MNFKFERNFLDSISFEVIIYLFVISSLYFVALFLCNKNCAILLILKNDVNMIHSSVFYALPIYVAFYFARYLSVLYIIYCIALCEVFFLKSVTLKGYVLTVL